MKLQVLLSVFLAGGSGFACRGRSDKPLEIKAAEDTTDKEDEIRASNDASTAGVRNYEQLYTTFSDLTGVPGEDVEYRGYFTKTVAGTLPTKNDLGLFSGSHQVAIINLASFALERSFKIKKDTAWNGGNCTGDDERKVFSPEGRLALAKSIFSNFWGVDKESITQDSPLFKDFSKLADTLIEGSNKMRTAASLPRTMVEGVCIGLATPALSSAIVTVYGG